MLETVVSNSIRSERSHDSTVKKTKETERKKKKKKLANQEDRKTEEAEKTINDLSNSALPAQSSQQTSISPPEEPVATQPDATKVCDNGQQPRERRRKKEKNKALPNSGVNSHTSTVGVAAKRDVTHISGAEGSKLMNKGEKSAVSAGDDIMVQGTGADVVADDVVSKTLHSASKKRKRKKTTAGTNATVDETVPTQNPKSMKIKKERIKAEDICDPLGNTSVQNLSESSKAETGNNDKNSVMMDNGVDFPTPKVEVKSDKAVSKTQNPKSAKKKRKRTKEVEFKDSGANTLMNSKDSASVQNLVECSSGKDIGNNDKTNPMGDNVVDIQTGDVKVTEAEGENIVASAGGDTEQRMKTDVVADEVLSKTQNPESQKKKSKKPVKSCDSPGTTLLNAKCSTSIQGLSECSGGKDTGNTDKKKKKKKKKKNRTTTIEVCDPSGNTLVQTKNNISVQTLSQSSGTKNVGNNEKNNASMSNGADFQTAEVKVAAKCDAVHISEAEGSKLSIGEKSVASAGSDIIVERDVKEKEAMSIPTRSSRKKKRRIKEVVCDLEETQVSEPVKSLSEYSNGKDTGINAMSNNGIDCQTPDVKATDMKSADTVSEPQNHKSKEKKRTKIKDVRETYATESKSLQSLSNYSDGENMVNNDRKAGQEVALRLQSERKEEKSRCDKENRSMNGKEIEVKSSLSSYDVGLDNVAGEVVPEETGGYILGCTCPDHGSKKLLVLDLNGILADIVQGYVGEITPDGRVSGRSVFRRPFLASFLEFCFERFDVGIWSSRRIGLSAMINIVMRDFANRLLFRMDSNLCTQTRFKTLENHNKPMVLKDLSRVWERFGKCYTCGKQRYNATNTLLIDDSPYKALCNPPYTGIFPRTYQNTDNNDSSLGPNGDLRMYLERMADAENVPKFVKNNPFGEPAISESHVSWEFYSKLVQLHGFKTHQQPSAIS